MKASEVSAQAQAALGAEIYRFEQEHLSRREAQLAAGLVEIEGIERHSLLPIARDVPRQDSFIAQLAHAESQACCPLASRRGLGGAGASVQTPPRPPSSTPPSRLTPNRQKTSC